MNPYSDQQDRETLCRLLGGPLGAGLLAAVLAVILAVMVFEWAAYCTRRSGIKILVSSFLLSVALTTTGYVVLVLLSGFTGG